MNIYKMFGIYKDDKKMTSRWRKEVATPPEYREGSSLHWRNLVKPQGRGGPQGIPELQEFHRKAKKGDFLPDDPEYYTALRNIVETHAQNALDRNHATSTETNEIMVRGGLVKPQTNQQYLHSLKLNPADNHNPFGLDGLDMANMYPEQQHVRGEDGLGWKHSDNSNPYKGD